MVTCDIAVEFMSRKEDPSVHKNMTYQNKNFVILSFLSIHIYYSG